MIDLFIWMVIAFFGWLIGGVVGDLSGHGWSPACWFGLALALGVSLCICAWTSDCFGKGGGSPDTGFGGFDWGDDD
jgi:hypothetical protein